MNLRRAAETETEEYSIALPKQSIIRLTGPAADFYLHSIPPVTSKRISFTLRRMSSRTRLDLAAKKAAKVKCRAARLERRALRRAKKKDKKKIQQKKRLATAKDNRSVEFIDTYPKLKLGVTKP